MIYITCQPETGPIEYNKGLDYALSHWCFGLTEQYATDSPHNHLVALV